MESMDIELRQPYPQLDVAAKLNQVLPTGIKIVLVEQLSGNTATPKPDRHCYEVQSMEPLFSPEKVEHFLNSTEFSALRKKPKETKRIDIRPLVSSILLHNLSKLEIMINTREKDNLKINDLVGAIFNLQATEALQLNILKQKSYFSR